MTKTKTSVSVRTAVVVGLIAAAGAAAAFFVLANVAPTFSLASSSPFGAGLPGLDEVFRFNVAAPASKAVIINELLFAMTSTDNDASGWNSCGKLSDPTLYDTDDLSTSLSATTVFYNSDMIACNGSDVVAYIGATFSTPVEIGAGATTTFSLHVDSIDASAVSDDAIRIDIPKTPRAVSWTDPRGVVRGANGLRALPVTGGTIIF